MDPKTIIKNDASLDFKFFFCPEFSKRVRAGKCVHCDKFPCETISGLIKDKEKDYYELVNIGKKSMKNYLVVTPRKREVISETSLKKRNLPDKCEVYEIKNEYKVENKLVKSERKQRDFFAYKEGDNELKQLKNIDYKSGDHIHELGRKSIVQKVLVKCDKPEGKKRGRKKKKKRKSAGSSSKKNGDS